MRRRVPNGKKRRKQRDMLRELVAKITRRNLPQWLDFGPPVGREVW